MTSATLTAIAFVMYLAAAVCYGATLFLQAPTAPTATPATAPPPAVGRFSLPLLLVGILTQFAAIGSWCVHTHRSPFASEYGTLAVTAWAIALAFAYLDIRTHLAAVGAVALPVACTVLFLGILKAQGPVAETPLLAQRIVSLHVLAILASFGLFAVAFGCAALYLLQNRLLRTHQGHGLFRRLPPLATLDSVAYHAVAYALPLLTLGLALGIAYAFHGGFRTSPHTWLWDSHTLISFVIWLLYVLYLTARLAAGWRGVRLQYLLLVGLLITLTLYMVPTSTHHFR
jgi:ABC-type transport system involved in cytochrome c biogenesis permease subunit